MAEFATSYIKTTSASVTRNADAASMTGTNFSSWFNNAEGTVYSEYATATPTTARIYQIGDGTINNRMDGLMATSAFSVFVQTNNSSQVSTTATGTLTANTFGKISFSYQTDNFALLLNAGTVATDTSGIVPVVNQMGIGRRLDIAGYINGTIKKLAYYPSRLPDAQLQALTS